MTLKSVLLSVVLIGGSLAGEADRIEKCIRDLGSSDVSVREAAVQDLEKIGEPAAEALYKASKDKDAEVSSP